MRHSLAVLALSDSFERLWEQFANSFDVDLLVGSTVAELGTLNAASCGIISVAGEEDRAPALLREFRGGHTPPLCVVSTDDDYRLAVTCVREGADQYFVLPKDTGALRSWVGEQVERSSAGENAAAFAEVLRKEYNFEHLVGQSPELLAALEVATKVMNRGSPTILITGETGTGKDLLARAIHYNGPRAAKPFVEVNCTALPDQLLEAELFGYEPGAFTGAITSKPGLFEAAHGGTLFLDEIGDINGDLQSKLLRALEDGWVRRLGSIKSQQVDVRIIAATNRDLAAAIREGKFRQDLHYRLNVYPIHLPPLRQRGGDVLVLARHYLDEFAREYHFERPPLSPSIAKVLQMHSWPGNVRELKNTIERAILLGDGHIRREHLFPHSSDTPPSRIPIPFPAPMEEIARAVAASTVTWCGGNKSQAAATLEISRKRLYTLLNGGEEVDNGSK